MNLIGFAIGIAIGVAMNSVPIGVAIGVALDLLFRDHEKNQSFTEKSHDFCGAFLFV